MKTTLKAKDEIAEGTLQVRLDTGGEPADFDAGQYMMVTLPGPPFTDDKGDTRFFSISSSPMQTGELEFTTRLSDSAFKRSVADMPLGSNIEVEIVGGDLVLPESAARPLILITGGIGITPFISMLRYIDEQKLSHKVTLLYSNRTADSTAYLSELKSLASRNENINIVFTMTDDAAWDGEKRRIDAEFIRDYVPGYLQCEYYATGSARMVEAIGKSLTELEVPLTRQHSEVFPGY